MMGKVRTAFATNWFYWEKKIVSATAKTTAPPILKSNPEIIFLMGMQS